MFITYVNNHISHTGFFVFKKKRFENRMCMCLIYSVYTYLCIAWLNFEKLFRDRISWNSLRKKSVSMHLLDIRSTNRQAQSTVNSNGFVFCVFVCEFFFQLSLLCRPTMMMIIVAYFSFSYSGSLMLLLRFFCAHRFLFHRREGPQTSKHKRIK